MSLKIEFTKTDIQNYYNDYKEEVFKIIKKINENIDKFLIKSTLIELENLLKIFSYSYFIKGESLISDLNYDIILNYVKNNNKNFTMDMLDYLDEQYNKAITLPYKMITFKKFYENDIKIKKYLTNNMFITSKLDGVSCLLEKNQDTIKLYTKGNSIQGRDITYILNLIPFHHNLNIVKKVVLRGELVINKKYASPDIKSLRSQVIGLINRNPTKLTPDDKELFKKIDIIFYQVIHPIIKYPDQLKSISKLGLKTIKYELIKQIYDENLSSKYENFLTNDNYELDGLVIYNSDHSFDLQKENNFIIGFKPNLIVGYTIVKNINWNVTSKKKIIPILEIEKIKLGNNIISKVNGYNAQYILKEQIGIGSQIKIKLSGNIIPTCASVITKSNKIPMPKVKVKWDKYQKHLLSEEIDLQILAKQIEKYYCIFNIKGFGYTKIQNIIIKLQDYSKNIIIENIFDYIEQISSWKQNNKNYIIGQKTDIIIYNTIEIFKKKPIFIASLLEATNEFDLLKKTKLILFFKAFNTLLNDFENGETISISKAELETIKNIGKITIDSFYKGSEYFFKNKTNFDKYFNIQYNLENNIESNTENSIIENSKMENKISPLKIVFSNIDKQTKINLFSQFPNRFLESSTLNNDINYLVIGEKENITEKIKNAKKKQIQILTLIEFKKLLSHIIL